MDITVFYELADKYAVYNVEKNELVNDAYLYSVENNVSPEDAFKQIRKKYIREFYKPVQSNICFKDGEEFDLLELIADEKYVTHNEGKRITDEQIEKVKKLSRIKQNSLRICGKIYKDYVNSFKKIIYNNARGKGFIKITPIMMANKRITAMNLYRTLHNNEGRRRNAGNRQSK